MAVAGVAWLRHDVRPLRHTRNREFLRWHSDRVEQNRESAILAAGPNHLPRGRRDDGVLNTCTPALQPLREREKGESGSFATCYTFQWYAPQ